MAWRVLEVGVFEHRRGTTNSNSLGKDVHERHDQENLHGGEADAGSLSPTDGYGGSDPAYDSLRVEPPLRRRPARREELAVELAGELRDLWPTCVPGFLKDRRDLGVRDEVLPALRIPVEEHPDPTLLIGIAKGV
jgi:hypothetical protein